MNIRDIKKGSVITTRSSRDEGGRVFILDDNYWNRPARQVIAQDGTHYVIFSRDIETVQVDTPRGKCFVPVTLTPKQQRDLKFTRMVEYNTSPESEAYWCS